MSIQSFIRPKILFKAHLIALIAGFLLPTYASAASKTNIDVNYNLKLAGFQLGSVGLAARLKQKSYAISIRAFTTGTLDRILRFTIETRARGVYNGAKINSTEYITAYSNKRVKRHVVVKYPNGQRAQVTATPPYRSFDDSVPLQAKHLLNVVDPLSAMLLPLNKKYKSSSASQCNRIQSVFDGVSRYKLQMRQATKPKTDNKMLQQAIYCKVGYTPISGHRKSRADRTIIDNYATATVWLLPLKAEGVLLPLKVEIPTQFGTFTIQAKHVDIDGKRLNF
ncbi:MAG: DUF3108 domain-containing protein [Rhizobiales bacterium]|nr:DUF3108 domain-containing protein [Hyphomicrobiales bacterium]NRB15641.1 DUF3108 domain-containing protein [Hyphomicrobiales bacterium]